MRRGEVAEGDCTTGWWPLVHLIMFHHDQAPANPGMVKPGAAVHRLPEGFFRQAPPCRRLPGLSCIGPVSVWRRRPGFTGGAGDPARWSGVARRGLMRDSVATSR